MKPDLHEESDPQLSGEMQSTVQSWIERFAAEPTVLSRYWYPLSVPAYDAFEITEALDSMCRFRTSMGTKTRQFERAFAEMSGSTDAIMVNSGSSADLLAAFLLNNPAKPLLQPGDEVLLPAVTWPTQIWSILMAGFNGCLVDVDPQTLNMDPDDLRAKITSKTKAIFVVHLMGCPMDMDVIQELADEYGLIILEDCCESLGATWDGQAVGTFGLAGTFSFFFSHHMTTMEGGMITCQDEQTASQLKSLRAHGWARDAVNSRDLADQYRCDPRYLFLNWGFNVRPTEVQASFGLHQLNRLPTFNERRNQLAKQFHDYVDSTPWLSRPAIPGKAQSSWFSLPLLVRNDAPFSRDQLATALEAAGVETRAIVTGNLARQPATQLFPQLHTGHLPGADQVHDFGMYLGLSPGYNQEHIARLISVFESCIAELSGQRSNRRAA
ncbi:MAG: DegT/DnrJ/EryC1/StrS family aminotransferase [Planctomycetales bacterium]|nr:DegT/DnrJ/EryC1/StrS family aminotransferase [Planctomycetales bacterium]